MKTFAFFSLALLISIASWGQIKTLKKTTIKNPTGTSPVGSELDKPNYSSGSLFPTNLTGAQHVDPQHLMAHNPFNVSNPTLYFAGTTTLGWVVVFKSEDGQRWEQADAGLNIKAGSVRQPQTRRYAQFYSVHDHLYLKVNEGSTIKVFKKDRNRDTWSEVTALRTGANGADSGWNIIGLTNALGKKVVLAADVTKLLRSEDGVNFASVAGASAATPNIFTLGTLAYFQPPSGTNKKVYEYNDLSKSARELSNTSKFAGTDEFVQNACYEPSMKGLVLMTSKRLLAGVVANPTSGISTYQPGYTQNLPAHIDKSDRMLSLTGSIYMLRTEGGTSGYKHIIEYAGLSGSNSQLFTNGNVLSKKTITSSSENQKVDICNKGNALWLIDDKGIYRLNSPTARWSNNLILSSVIQ